MKHKKYERTQIHFAQWLVNHSVGGLRVTWRITLDKWSKGQSILDSSSDLLNKLQTSVDALDEIKEKPDLQNCCLDLGSFPEDERIPALLFMTWVELYNLDEEDMYTYEYLEELSMRNLNDLLTELAIYLSNQKPVEPRKRVILEITGNKLPKWWAEKMQEPINARLLSISTDEAFSLCFNSIQLPKVEVLILNSRTKNFSLPLFVQKPELNNFSEVDYLSNLKRIRFEHVSISSLGTSLEKPLKLQKISLIMCKIGKAFDNCTICFRIEIAYCADLVEFPVELCKIGHLKKLSITEYKELIALPEALGALTSLEVLRLHSCTKLEGLPESIGNLHKLKSLDISNCVSMSKMPVRMGELCNLRTLYMSGCWGLSELPQSVEDLDQQLKRRFVCLKRLAPTASVWPENPLDLASNPSPCRVPQAWQRWGRPDTQLPGELGAMRSEDMFPSRSDPGCPRRSCISPRVSPCAGALGASQGSIPEEPSTRLAEVAFRKSRLPGGRGVEELHGGDSVPRSRLSPRVSPCARAVGACQGSIPKEPSTQLAEHPEGAVYPTGRGSIPKEPSAEVASRRSRLPGGRGVEELPGRDSVPEESPIPVGESLCRSTRSMSSAAPDAGYGGRRDDVRATGSRSDVWATGSRSDVRAMGVAEMTSGRRATGVAENGDDVRTTGDGGRRVDVQTTGDMGRGGYKAS
ncbi:hypothetical protein RJ640_000347 [Escallonia rubra]|uniref:Disease resistance R13L4/SHOC-2-like LRR domain-containing protein n=1 Tax=Escallonia rubra TaxID=112253 RepID=A0AA88QI86_9ASTE|nr:hypothetical protein RJ640_000347 [Escallonia rubra]